MLTGIGDLFSIIMEYEALRCFFRLDGCMKHFCVSLNLYGGMIHFGISLVQMGGTKHFTVFPGKKGHETFSETHSEGTKHFEFFAQGV